MPRLSAVVRLRIRKLLDRRRMTVYALAKATHIPMTTAYRLVRGEVKRVDVRLIDRLCTILECQPGDLFERH